jgi:hypothetical protein
MAPRDRWVNYGIPPRHDQQFQRTGRGAMFEEPHRVVRNPAAVAVHLIVHDEHGMTVPSLSVDARRRERHVQLYGSAGVTDRRRTRGTVRQLREAGRTSLEIADELGVSVRTVERHLRDLPHAAQIPKHKLFCRDFSRHSGRGQGDLPLGRFCRCGACF